MSQETRFSASLSEFPAPVLPNTLTDRDFVALRTLLLHGPARPSPIMVVTCAGIMLYLPWHQSDVMVIALVFSLAFGAACSLAKNNLTSRVVVVSVGFASGILVMAVAPVSIAFVFLISTVIHVSLFTFLFMISGALLPIGSRFVRANHLAYSNRRPSRVSKVQIA